MAVAEFVSREVVERPGDLAKVNVEGIEAGSGTGLPKRRGHGTREGLPGMYFYSGKETRREIGPGRAKPRSNRRCTRIGEECATATARAYRGIEGSEPLEVLRLPYGVSCDGR
jgi:hypothetical protein